MSARASLRIFYETFTVFAYSHFHASTFQSRHFDPRVLSVDTRGLIIQHHRTRRTPTSRCPTTTPHSVDATTPSHVRAARLGSHTHLTCGGGQHINKEARAPPPWRPLTRGSHTIRRSSRDRTRRHPGRARSRAHAEPEGFGLVFFWRIVSAASDETYLRVRVISCTCFFTVPKSPFTLA